MTTTNIEEQEDKTQLELWQLLNTLFDRQEETTQHLQQLDDGLVGPIPKAIYDAVLDELKQHCDQKFREMEDRLLDKMRSMPVLNIAPGAFQLQPSEVHVSPEIKSLVELGKDAIHVDATLREGPTRQIMHRDNKGLVAAIDKVALPSILDTPRKPEKDDNAG